MKKIYLLFSIAYFVSTQAQQQKPKLVIGIVVDQMRMEYLYRFADDFSGDGFKRIMKKGYTFHNIHHNYVPTYTAPGHASIYTGTTPSSHGIIANEWFNKTTGKEIYCTEDESVKTVGNGSEKEGMMSPKNLLNTTITDELKMATNFNSKVIGISLKDRGAILPAGHFANGAYWYSKTGNFISSTFYAKGLPDWLVKFNDDKHYMPYLNEGWYLHRDLITYNESLIDDNIYERDLDPKTGHIFPYNLKQIYLEKGIDVLRNTPFGNNLLAELAMLAIEKEDLGIDDITDFLSISFSSTDYIGHLFGPRSIEIQDTYLRLDDTIAELLTYLDKKVGEDNYLLFLTSDHGSAENTNYLKNLKYNVENVPAKSIENKLRKYSTDKFGVDVIQNYSNFNLFLNKQLISKDKRLDLIKIKESFKSFLMTQDYVKRVYSEEEILASNGNDYYLNFIAKGYNSKQNGDLVISYRIGYVESSHDTGTSHGSANSYDTHVPLLFYGWNIPKGNSYAKKSITQIAPTLSQLLKIPFTNGTDSEVLEEVLINNKK